MGFLPKMHDMARTAEEKADKPSDCMPYPVAEQRQYPYGLCISLGNDELEKLDLSAECDVGDLIHLFAMAKVTSVSKNDTGNGPQCRIELQITHLGLEDEDEETEASED